MSDLQLSSTTAVAQRRLPVDPEVIALHARLCHDHSEKILARADIIARERQGNSIQAGDLQAARQHIDKQSIRSAAYLLLAGAALGASLSGIPQNVLDDKPMAHFFTFVAIGVVGLLAAWSAFRQR